MGEAQKVKPPTQTQAMDAVMGDEEQNEKKRIEAEGETLHPNPGN